MCSPIESNALDNHDIYVLPLTPKHSTTRFLGCEFRHRTASFRQAKPEVPTRAKLSVGSTYSQPPPADGQSADISGECGIRFRLQNELIETFAATSVEMRFLVIIVEACDECQGRFVLDRKSVQDSVSIFRNSRLCDQANILLQEKIWSSAYESKGSIV